MDEIGRNSAANDAKYGEEQRNAFLKWLQESAAKAKEAYEHADRDSYESYALKDFYIAIGSALNVEKDEEKLYAGNEEEMSEDDRVDALDEFRRRLIMSLNDFRSTTAEYRENQIYQWADHPEFNEFENRLQAEIDAVENAMKALDPPQKNEIFAAHRSEDLNESRESEADENEAEQSVDSAVNLQGMDSQDPEDIAKADEERRIRQGIEKQRRQIANRAKLLKDSKTLVNSKEYCDLIDLMEKVGSGKIDPIPGKDAREQFAQELYAIHAQTEKYLAHKAKDGVKKNAYRKLLAVEKTSETLQLAIAELGDVTITTTKSGQKMPLRDLPVKLESRAMGAAGEKYAARTDYVERAETLMENNAGLGNRISKLTIADCIRSVDVCMSKIMIKVEAEGDQVARHSLAAVKQSFLDDPFPVVQEHAAQMAKKGVDKNLGL